MVSKSGVCACTDTSDKCYFSGNILSASRLLVCIPAVVILWSIILALVYTSCGLGFLFSAWFFYLWLQVMTVFKPEIVYSVAGLLAYTFTVTSG